MSMTCEPFVVTSASQQKTRHSPRPLPHLSNTNIFKFNSNYLKFNVNKL